MVTTAKVSGENLINKNKKQEIHILATAMTAMIVTLGVTYMTPTFLIFFR